MGTFLMDVFDGRDAPLMNEPQKTWKTHTHRNCKLVDVIISFSYLVWKEKICVYTFHDSTPTHFVVEFMPPLILQFHWKTRKYWRCFFSTYIYEYIKNHFWQKKLEKRNMKQTNVNPKVKCRKTKYQAICYHGFRPFYTKKNSLWNKSCKFFKNVLSTRTKFAQVDHESI